MSKCHSKLNRRKRYALYLEALESRQLLATVWGGGEEVGSDIAFQGNTYDQVLMTGGTVVIEADPGQIVRTSYLDGNGDILQAEFSACRSGEIQSTGSGVCYWSSQLFN